jgi:hypothetical protein
VERAAATLVVCLLALLSVPPAASADAPGRGRLFVPGDSFHHGESFSIIGTDLDPGVDVTLLLRSGSTTAEIGRVTVAADRSIASTGVVPAGFPTGYAELMATASSGASWSTYILVGDRPEGPRPVGGGEIGEQTLGLIALGIGLLLVAVGGLVLLLGRRQRVPRAR